MTLETTKDLLFVVLALSALWLTIFLSRLLYYWIALFRDAEALVRQVKNAVTKVEDVTHTIKEKFEHSAASLTILAQAVKEIVMWAMQERAQKRRAGKKKTSSQEE
ncbi:MAG: hypothetical protein WCT10_05330 [Patescibacteria group bacterium]|jgi:hypothetical protein